MSDIHYIKTIARNSEVLTQWRITSSKGMIQVLLVELVHHITRRCLLLVLWLKVLKKIPTCKIWCVKNLISVRMKPFGCNKRFVTCKSSGYQTMRLNPTSWGKIIFKINRLDRIFSTWVMERSPPHQPKFPSVDSPYQRFIAPLNNNFLSNNLVRTSFLL